MVARQDLSTLPKLHVFMSSTAQGFDKKRKPNLYFRMGQPDPLSFSTGSLADFILGEEQIYIVSNCIQILG